MVDPYKTDWRAIAIIFMIVVISFSASVGFAIVGWFFNTYGG